MAASPATLRPAGVRWNRADRTIGEKLNGSGHGSRMRIARDSEVTSRDRRPCPAEVSSGAGTTIEAANSIWRRLARSSGLYCHPMHNWFISAAQYGRDIVNAKCYRSAFAGSQPIRQGDPLTQWPGAAPFRPFARLAEYPRPSYHR